MIRRFGQPPRADQHYRIRPGVYAVLQRGPSILATFQAEPEPEFQLPGGGINKNEHPLTALHREVFEETGWKMDITRRLGAFRRFTYMPEYDLWAEKLCTVYLARPIYRLSAPLESGHTAVWLPISDALNLLGNSGDRHMLGQVFK